MRALRASLEQLDAWEASQRPPFAQSGSPINFNGWVNTSPERAAAGRASLACSKALAKWRGTRA